MIPKGKNEGKGKGGEGRKNDSGKSVWGKKASPPHLAPSDQPANRLPLHLTFSAKHPPGPTRLPQRQGSEASPYRELLFFAGTSSLGEEPSVPRGSTGQQQTVESKEGATSRAGGWKYELCSQEVNLQPCTQQWPIKQNISVCNSTADRANQSWTSIY